MVDKNSIKQKVSVIIPCYNRVRFIGPAIESVLSQTYPNIEIMAVDDGSSDGTRGVLDRYRQQITILEHEGRVNKGQSAAINLGLSHSTGTYIALLDSDDLFRSRKIERQVVYLEKHPDVGLVYTNGHAIDEKGNILYPIYQPGHTEASNPSRVLLNCYFLVPNNSLVRKSIYGRVGTFDESLRASQDHDMAIRIAEVTKLAYFDEHLFYYRRHSDSISSMKADLRWKNGFIILANASSRYPYSRRTVQLRKAVLHFRLGQCALERGSYLEAIFRWLLAGLLDPLRSLRVIAKREQITSPH